PRKTLISLNATPYYHCVSRCVRRAFLCGNDNHSGNNYEHRRQWIEDKILKLGQVFAIDVCNYAIMHNHYHVLLHINSNDADNCSANDIIERWHQLFKGTVLTQRFINGDSMDKAELQAIEKLVTEWRSRLMDISWFMRILNESIAREANKEDNCTGRFWEGRFYSQALLDDKALAACMVYIDLNPIRAGIAKTPEASQHTSIRYRIKTACQSQIPNRIDQQPPVLFPFSGNPRHDSPAGIQLKLTDYIELVEWSARQIRHKKKSAIASTLPPILNQLGMESDNWLFLCEHFELPFKSIVGSALSVKRVCVQLQQRWIQGQRQCERLFSSS
ncbi:MAG: transposase, partial [Thiohalomonadales bacterium]